MGPVCSVMKTVPVLPTQPGGEVWIRIAHESAFPHWVRQTEAEVTALAGVSKGSPSTSACCLLLMPADGMLHHM